MLWVLLVFVVILAGLIAYVADNVARRVGRRHIRLFGLRPKTTALIYAVATGMGISFLSMLGFALINRQAILTINRAEQYRDELQQLKVQIAPLRKNKAQLETALKTTQANVVRLSEERSKALKDQENLKKQADGLRSEVAELKEYRVALEAQNQKMNARADALFQQGQVLEQSIRELEIKSNALEAQNRNLRSSYDKMVGDLETERAQYQTIQTQYQQARTQYQAAQQQAKEAQQQARAAQQQSTQALQQYQAAQQQIKQISPTLEALRQEQRGLKKENDSLKKARQAAQGEVSGLQYLRAQLIKESEDLKKDNAGLRATLKQMTQETTQLRTEASQLKTNLDQQRTELEARRTQDAIYEKGDLVYQGIIQAEDGQDGLNRALRQAELKAISRGAKGKPNAVQAATDDLGVLTQNLKSMQGEVLVVVRAVNNQVKGFPVNVDVNVVENRVLVPREQPIRSKLVSVGTTGVKTNRELTEALQDLALEAVQALQEKGIPLENLPSGLSTADTVNMVNNLKTLKGNVMIGIMSRSDIKPGSKVVLYPRVLR